LIATVAKFLERFDVAGGAAVAEFALELEVGIVSTI
jgi:hypothetical protein